MVAEIWASVMSSFVDQLVALMAVYKPSNGNTSSQHHGHYFVVHQVLPFFAFSNLHLESHTGPYVMTLWQRHFQE